MFVKQKAQDIAYAAIRIASFARRNELKQRLEKLAFQLVEEVSAESLDLALRSLGALDELVALGKRILEVEPGNASYVSGEIGSLIREIRQQIYLEPALPNIDNGNEARGNEANNTIAELPNAAMRQSAIAERIRQSANRQLPLKELIAAFPEISERTMRYDLQKLCGQGLLQRVGSGGPGSYYVIK